MTLKWKSYMRVGIIEMRPYIVGENLSNINISTEITPKEGGMIARNPMDHKDQWYVTEEDFKENMEEIKEYGTIQEET
jgi:chlorite dismutase